MYVINIIVRHSAACSFNLLLVCFLSIVALEKIFDWGGEQLAMYCGDNLGDLIVITLNKYIQFIGVQ
jgi:hypothetical protein